jgi:hypothetical protein
MKRRSLRGLVTIIALFGAISLTSAQSMFDNFDSYTVGSIHGQGGWEGWTGIAGAAGDVTTLQASSGTQSLQVVAGNDTVRPFSGVAGGLWTLSLQQYVPSASSGGSWIILMNNYPTTPNWSAQLFTDISGNAMTSSQVPIASAPLVKDQWVDIRFEINLDANSVTSYYNNTLLATHAWQSSGINEFRALDLYPDEDTAGGTAQVGSVFYDNVQLTLVPEPSTFGLLVLGGLAVLYRFRKQA